jgi:hypothetical protein
MSFKRFSWRARHNYHDAQIISIEISETDVTFVADLIPHRNRDAARGVLIFHNVKNLEEVRRSLPPTQIKGTAWRPEILDVSKVGKTRYVVDAYISGSYRIEIDCQGLTEI